MNITRIMQEAASNVVPWDINKLAFNGGPINWGVAPRFRLLRSPRGMRFKPDGTALATINPTFELAAVTLSVPWDVRTTESDASNINISGADLYIKSDGGTLFTIGGGLVTEYSLSPAWDFENETSVQTKDLSVNVGTATRGIDFKSDGTVLYIGTISTIYEFALSSAWDISTATLATTFNYTQGATSNHGSIRFKSDGTAFSVAFTDSVHEYSLSSAWDVSSSSYANPFSAPAYFYTDNNTTPAIEFKPDGEHIYLAYDAASSTTDLNYVGPIFDVGISSAWDLSTASFTAPSSDFYPLTFNDATGLAFKSDGTSFYVSTEEGDIYQHNMSLAWDITTASVAGSYNISAFSSSGLFISDDGVNLYTVRGDSIDSVYQYVMGTPWDITTLSLVRTKSVSAQVTTPKAVSFKADGTRMYIGDTAGPTVFEYSLSTPWNVSTASFVRSKALTVPSSFDGIYGMYFRPDGGVAYFALSLIFDVNSSVLEVDIETDWDISTFQENLQVSLPDTMIIRDVDFKTNGKKMFVLSYPFGRIISYDL